MSSLTGKRRDPNNLTRPLAREEERELARRAESGDKAALNRLVTSHIRFVFKIAKGYRQSGIPMSDLVQEGMIGLIQAVRRFNPERDVRLASYAVWSIRAAIQDHVVRSWSLVRLSTTSAQKSLFLQLRKRTAELIGNADQLSEEFLSKLAERFGTTASDVANLANRISARDQSLNAPLPSSLDDESTGSWLEALESSEPTPEERLSEVREQRRLQDVIARALDALPDRERFIIQRRYLEEAKHTFASLGKELNLSKDRVRQLEAKALNMLRDILEPSLADHLTRSGGTVR